MAGRLHTKLQRSLSASLHLFALLSVPAAHAARPFITDDARVVDQGHCQVETYYKEQRAYPGSEYWLLPACNPFGVELTLGGNRAAGERNAVAQGKTLLRELRSNDFGLAASAGAIGEDAFVNGIASFSFLDDRAVVHTNLGVLRRPTWGVGLEALLAAPRVYGIAEAFGVRGEKATLHYGVRFWVVPGRFQIDATRGVQDSAPATRFYTVGLRVIF